MLIKIFSSLFNYKLTIVTKNRVSRNLYIPNITRILRSRLKNVQCFQLTCISIFSTARSVSGLKTVAVTNFRPFDELVLI